jgi:hypothetical protein
MLEEDSQPNQVSSTTKLKEVERSGHCAKEKKGWLKGGLVMATQISRVWPRCFARGELHGPSSLRTRQLLIDMLFVK